MEWVNSAPVNYDYVSTNFGNELSTIDSIHFNENTIFTQKDNKYNELFEIKQDLVKYLKYKRTLVSYEKIDDVWWKFINTFEYKDCIMEHHCLSYDSLSLAIKRSIENMFQEWDKKINEKKG